MKTPKVIIKKQIDWHEYDILGFSMDDLKAGRYSWWANFVKLYKELYIEMYDDCFEVMLKDRNGISTSLSQLSYNHFDVKMTKDRDMLLLISHPDFGKIYTAIFNEDIEEGSWMQIMKLGRKKNEPDPRRPVYREVLF